ncbi:PITH domain-containing protein [Copromyces sp. CBS 386.78]|nr:PITH domain-containing protein [Copromyces sp. CBS 386.78]
MVSAAVEIQSPAEWSSLLDATKIVVVLFYSPSNAASLEAIHILEHHSQGLEGHGTVLELAKVNVDELKAIKSAYSITQLPTTMLFQNGKEIDKVSGDNVPRLTHLIEKLKRAVDSAKTEKASGSSSSWKGAALPRGYVDVTDQVELNRSELLNVDTDTGGVRVLFSSEKPSALSGGKATAKDWVESDTDDQLLLFMPFQSMLKLHTLQITSLPPTDDDDDEAPMRPKTIKLFVNKPHNLGFDEAEDLQATQDIELSESDWNKEGTASIPLRYVRFQNINTLVLFVVNGDGDSEKVRIDRLRLIGESGAARDMGKLEKIGDLPGE